MPDFWNEVIDQVSSPLLAEADRLDLQAEERSLDRFLAAFNVESADNTVLRTNDVAEIRGLLPSGLPEQGMPLEEVVAELTATAGQFRRHNDHPGFYGWIASSGLPTDPLGHALTAALNQNLTGFHSAPGASVIEQTLLGWIARLAGLPDSAGGLIVSGGSMANISALTVALYSTLGESAVRQGIGTERRPVILVAENVHFSVRRAAIMLGIGLDGIETIPVDTSQRMRVDLLADRMRALASDKEKTAFSVVASAGSTATGSIDALEEIADLTDKYGVWLHVDAAYGGAALLSADLRPRLKGIEYADSVSFDLHKWAYLGFDGSILLYRNPQAARRLFAVNTDYANFSDSAHAAGPVFIDLSPEVSRRARALPAWLALRYFGIGRLGRNIRHNAECAAWLATLVRQDPDLELVTAPDLSICCFRYLPRALNNHLEQIDELNEALLEQLNADGDYLLSPTRIKGRPVLRVCICSHKTRAHHITRLVSRVKEIGRRLLSQAAGEER